MLYANSGTGLMRWNMPLWYIPMIFVLLLMAFWIFRSKDDLKWNIMVFLISALVAFILCEEIKLPNLPFGLETAIYMFPFYALGKVIGRVKDEFTRKSILAKIAVTVGCLAVGTFMTIGNGQVSYNADSYGTHGFGYFLVMATMLCVGFVSLAMCFQNGVTPINYVGRNTVGIMVMHKFPILVFVGLFHISKKTNWNVSVSCIHCGCDSFDWNVLGCFRSDLSSMPNSIGKKEEINAKEESSGVGNAGDSIWRSENDTDRYGYAVG